MNTPLPSEGEAKTILIVDDTGSSLRLLDEVLKKAGYQTRLANGGDLALQAAELIQPDLILTDIQMPGMSGLELCRRLKEQSATMDIPVILLSAYAGVNEWVEGLQLGAADHLPKPFQETELLTRVRTHIALREARNSMQEVGKLLSLNRQLQDEITLRQKRESDLRAVIEASTEGVYLLDTEGIVLEVNETMARRLGVTPDAMRGKPIHGFFEPTVAAFRKERMEGVIRTRSSIRFTDQRDQRLIDQTMRPILDAKGEVKRLAVFAEDITEQVETMRLLQESEQLYRAMFEHSAFGMAQTAPDTGRLLRVNPELCRLMGYSEAELLERCWQDITAPEDQALSSTTMNSLWDSGKKSIRFEKRYLRKDGSTLWASVNVMLIRGGPKRTYFVASIEDITERRQSLIDLQEYKATLATALSSMTDAVFISDLAGRFIEFNEAFATFHRFKDKETCPRARERFRDLLELRDLSGNLIPYEDWTVARALRGESTKNLELELRRKDTGENWTGSFSFAPIRDPKGAIVGAVVTGRDVTEQRKLRAQFLHTQRLEAIGTLSSGIAHDLNNILAPMLMATGVLSGSLCDPRDVELLGMIERSAHRGADIVKQLLTFSRGIEGHRVNVQLRHLVREIVSIARETFPRNITILENCDRGLSLVFADATQIHQVLMNLCVNARDSMPDGGELRIAGSNLRLEEGDARLQAGTQPGDYILISVSDTGTGIAPDILGRIFEPFFTTKDVGKGTGLGLSTALGIVRSHGGILSVESTLDKGSQFNVYLPVATDGANMESPEEPIVERGHGETILVIDDELPIQQTIARCLEENGFRTLIAKNGQEGLLCFIENQSIIKLIITDVMMPVMNGIKMAQAIRNLDPHIKMIASSGLDLEADQKEVQEGIIAEFLKKPFERDVFLRAVHRQL